HVRRPRVDVGQRGDPEAVEPGRPGRKGDVDAADDEAVGLGGEGLGPQAGEDEERGRGEGRPRAQGVPWGGEAPAGLGVAALPWAALCELWRFECECVPLLAVRLWVEWLCVERCVALRWWVLWEAVFAADASSAPSAPAVSIAKAAANATPAIFRTI